jgi:hypothetical protein
MTRKIYKSAMGKTVDLGALLLQNEQVRAVGNMGVNAAGDLIDESNRVIDQRNRQVQRQYKRQTNVSNTPVVSSNLAARKMQADTAKKNQTKPKESKKTTVIDDALTDSVIPSVVAPESARTGGLAAAIARSKEIKQELEKTLQQQKAEQGLKKI